MQGEVPGPRDVVERQVVDNGLAAEQLAAEHIGQDTPIVMQVHKHGLPLTGRGRGRGRGGRKRLIIHALCH